MASKRSKLELCLLILVAITMLAGIAMCICLFLILPSSWTDENYVHDSDGNRATLIHKCKCKIIESANQPPAGGSLKSVFNLKEDTQLDVSFSRNKIRFFPYLVSLSIPAYVDQPGEMKFACSGVIVAKNWVLTGKISMQESNVSCFCNCVRKNLNLRAVRIVNLSTVRKRGRVSEIEVVLVISCVTKCAGIERTA